MSKARVKDGARLRIALWVLAAATVVVAVAIGWPTIDDSLSRVAPSNETHAQQSVSGPVSAVEPLRAASTRSESAPTPSSAPSVRVPRAPKTLAQPTLDTAASTLYERIAASGANLANAGDVVKLARTVDRCWSAMNYERIARATPPADDPRLHAEAHRIARAERDSARELCDGLPADVYERVDRWIAELAAQGDPGSMFAYGALTFWVRDPIKALRDPGRLTEFRNNTLNYLDELITRGYADALVAMASIKLNPAWGEPDPAASWAYIYAASKAQGDTARQAKLLQSLNDRVAPAERIRAQTLAKDIFARCCER